MRRETEPSPRMTGRKETVGEKGVAGRCAIGDLAPVELPDNLHRTAARPQLGPVSYTHLRAHETGAYL
eukprot:6383974-Pyramimonas_sp.AAC.1